MVPLHGPRGRYTVVVQVLHEIASHRPPPVVLDSLIPPRVGRRTDRGLRLRVVVELDGRELEMVRVVARCKRPDVSDGPVEEDLVVDGWREQMPTKPEAHADLSAAIHQLGLAWVDAS